MAMTLLSVLSTFSGLFDSAVWQPVTFRPHAGNLLSCFGTLRGQDYTCVQHSIAE